ncbi:protein kinase [Streptomyces sp. MUM 16J]|uniref:protein kinase n=1 Tax=Streptomyces sp. MUM 16J TaxID=2791988 RepID=UPI001F033B6F|nr:protein kinase [Streptomyces sp. MUM 16J]MCH0556357.1 protein kinase [Streptomyces sp. MUM 16J]
MDDYAGRVLADRYRLPQPPSDEYELTETRAFDTYSGQEVLVRQVALPEVVEAEVLDAEGLPEGFTARARGARPAAPRTATRRPADPVVRRAIEAAQAAASIPDHPRLDQVFDVFAEGGSLWIVSELVTARPLAELLAERPLTPYRAAEVASDVLMALRVLHAHGWVHRNVTGRTVLVCDDGRVMLTGLAVGAAEEALCGYDPVPVRQELPDPAEDGAGTSGAVPAAGAGTGDGPALPAQTGPSGSSRAPEDASGRSGPTGPTGPAGSGGRTDVTAHGGGVPSADAGPETARRAAIQARAAGRPAVHTANGAPRENHAPSPAGQRAMDEGADVRAARAGAIAAYRAGARAAARVAQQDGLVALPGARPAAEGGAGADPLGGAAQTPFPAGPGGPTPPGRAADHEAVQGAPWHGASPRSAPGGTSPSLGRAAPAPRTAALQPQAPEPSVLPAQSPAGWDDQGAGNGVRRGPATALAAERARQMRMTVVGPVTERWAPEQAGPVHENWQLAAPVGPVTDLWALGALLFRAVQGHAPYPEESTAELVQLVCAEPPAFAEECGPLRPVVESLLRQDPTERPDVEELSGWLRSLVRSAPEPEAGTHVVPVPPAAPNRLPIVRRRGELVRRRRAGLPAAHPHGRHKRAREDRHNSVQEEGGSPRRLGRLLLLLILLLLAAAISFAMLFLPKRQGNGAAANGAAAGDRTGVAGQASSAPAHSPEPSSGQSTPGGDSTESAPATETQTGGDPVIADGFTLRKDPGGFQVAVAKGWVRRPKNGSGQVVFTHGNFELIVVAGRDDASSYGSDPMAYQRDKERELQPYRDSSWATATGLRTIEVGGRTMAEGQFTWSDGRGHNLFVRNMAILLDGRYHILQVRGPEADRDEVTRLYEQATATYRFTR